MKNMVLLILTTLLIFGCRDEIPTEQTSDSLFPEIFQKGLEAHGGLDRWKQFGTLRFSEVAGSDTLNYTVDLRNRFELIEKEGQYKIGFTSDEITISPHPDSFPNENPRFYHNLRFYFFALPFVTADPGARQVPLSPAALNGKMYNRIKISFDEGIGAAPKDQYILWYDSSTNLLEYINYSVTFFNEANADQYNAIGYKAWQSVEGLTFPTEINGYQWENDSLGSLRYTRRFFDISLSRERPDPQIFMN